MSDEWFEPIGSGISQLIRGVGINDGKVHVDLLHGYDIHFTVEEATKFIKLLTEARNKIDPSFVESPTALHLSVFFSNGEIDWKITIPTFIRNLSIGDVEHFLENDSDVLKYWHGTDLMGFIEEHGSIDNFPDLTPTDDGYMELTLTNLIWEESDSDEYGRKYNREGFSYDLTIDNLYIHPKLNETENETDTDKYGGQF